MIEVSDKAKQVANELESIINQFCNTEDTNYIVNHLTYMHRTLNQSFVSKIILPFLREMHFKYESNSFDGRNEAACKICSLMWKKMCDEHGFKYDAKPTLALI